MKSNKRVLGFPSFSTFFVEPMTTLKELWTSKTENAEVNTTFQYVIDLQEKLDDTCKMTEEQLVKSSVRYKKYYNRKA